MNFLDTVSEFHERFRYKWPSPPAPDLEPATVTLRCELITEELRELRQAESRIDQLDALCDLQYVLSGAVLALGLREAFELFEFQLPRGEKCSEAYYLNLISESSEALFIAHDHTSAACALYDIQDAIRELVSIYRFADVFEVAFAEVHASNMRKLWLHEEYVEAMNRGEPIYAEAISVTQCIVRRNDGKIMKGPRWKSPDLGRYV